MKAIWVRWLEVVGGVFVTLGLYMAIAGGTGAFTPLSKLIDPTFWGDDGPSTVTHDFQTWIYAVLGATMVALGVLVFALARFGLGSNLMWAWWALIVGVSSWFVFDTTASLMAEVWVNAIGNTVILIAIAIPLVGWRRDR